ncbi:MAG: DUF5591 domain-containing protein [Candidatus Helarchaeota archaeon]
MPEPLFFLKGVGKDYTDNEIFNRAHEKIIKEYIPEEEKVALFTVCSWGKPYRQSYIHYFILRSLIQNGFLSKLGLIVLTNAGVIPYELTDDYPYFSYDWDPNLETDTIKQAYIEILERRLIEFLETKRKYYSRFCCYLRHESESYKVIQQVEEKLGILIPNFSLPEREITQEEYEQISLGFYDDHDIYLIVARNLNHLTDNLKRFL